MKCEHVDAAHAAMLGFAASDAGFSRGQIWDWFLKYGWPALLQILPIILPLILEKKVSLADAGKWVAAALANYVQGKDLPPVPASK